MNSKFLFSMDNNNKNPQHSEFNRFSYLTQHSIRARFMSGDVRHREFELPRNPVDIRGSYQQELEKERMRAVLIADEIMRRRSLEEEVRMDMLMERELALRRAEQGFGIGRSLGPMRIETPRVPLLTNFEHRGGGVSLSAGRVGFRGGLETMPFQRDPVVARKGYVGENAVHEFKEVNGVLAPSEGSSKDKVIILAKPSANLAEIKRKAMMSPVGGSIEVLKKQKSKEDWSCALCRITATSERGLNEHLQGKKHKTRERGMVTQRTGFGIGPSTKMSSTDTGEPFSLPNISSTPSLKKDEKVHNAPTVNLSGVYDNDTIMKSKETLAEERETVVKEPTDKLKKKFRFFCEICQAGAFSSKVFNAHKRGKRHLRKFSEVNKTDDASQVDPSVHKGAFEENKETEIVAIENVGTGTQVETNGVDAKNNVDLLEDKESLEIVGCETVAPMTIDQEAAASIEVSGPKVAMEENKEVNVAAEITKKVTVTEGEQVETDAVDVDNDVNRVENKETVLEIVGSETLASKTTNMESVCNGIDDMQMVPIQSGETMAPKTNDQESVWGDDMQKVPEPVSGDIVAPMTIDQESVCDGLDSMLKVPKPVSGAHQEFVCDGIDDMQKGPEPVIVETVAPKTTDQESVCDGIDDMHKTPEPVSSESVAPKTTDQKSVRDKVDC